MLDASIVGCWCFPDEASAIADAASERLTAGEARVPALWWFEVRNLLIASERRGRLDAVGTGEFLTDLAKLPIRTDRDPDSAAVLALARQHRLTVYDAAYLELARRLDAPLATLDRELALAARAAAVPLLGGA
ncbi:MAG: type II toxin-antitoxin system VapC family toxin [Geminicoccaceae bacterium]